MLQVGGLGLSDDRQIMQRCDACALARQLVMDGMASMRHL
jgi:hypothetical protein